MLDLEMFEKKQPQEKTTEECKQLHLWLKFMDDMKRI